MACDAVPSIHGTSLTWRWNSAFCPGATLARRKAVSGASAIGWTVLLGLLVAVPSAHAGKWDIKPSIAVNETLTNNVFLSSSNPTSDLVTSITPGISINGKGGRGSLRLDYGWTQNLYLHESSSNNHQNSLRAFGTLEAVEDWLFIDASGTISQQYLTALGRVSPSSASVNSNQTETSSYTLAPYIKGRLGKSVDYLFKYSAATTSSKSNLVSDQTTQQWIGRVNGQTPLTAVTWSLDASKVSVDYDVGRDRDDTRYGATIAYRFNPQLQTSLIFGRETTNLVTLQEETHNDSGFGILWTPGPRTKFEGTVTRRFFGNGYQAAFTHRMPRSSLSYTASRQVSYQPAGVGNTGQGSNYDAFYAIVAANNPGMSPEAINEQVVQILQNRGLPVDGTVVNGFLTNRPSLQQLQQLSLALIGVRNTVTFTATESSQQPLGLVSGLTDDFSLSNRVRQRGLGVVWGHQLSGSSSLSLSLNQQESTRFTAGNPDTKTQGAYLLFTTRLSPHTNVNMTVRRVISDGETGYNESALTGGLTHAF